MSLPKKAISEQIIDFIKAHAEKVNREGFTTIEFVIVNGKLDGMRLKEYLKAEKATANWEKRVESGITSKT